MSTPIEQNTAGLEEILRTVNALPNAGGGSAELTLADQATGKKYKIYVSSGKLTMEEV